MLSAPQPVTAATGNNAALTAEDAHGNATPSGPAALGRRGFRERRIERFTVGLLTRPYQPYARVLNWRLGESGPKGQNHQAKGHALEIDRWPSIRDPESRLSRIERRQSVPTASQAQLQNPGGW
jgi:hypothetical protein